MEAYRVVRCYESHIGKVVSPCLAQLGSSTRCQNAHSNLNSITLFLHHTYQLPYFV
jgi:hypothetical protein